MQQLKSVIAPLIIRSIAFSHVQVHDYSENAHHLFLLPTETANFQDLSLTFYDAPVIQEHNYCR